MDARYDCKEIFGPAFLLYRVNSAQEALELANSSANGLTATVFSESPLYCKNMALKLRVGVVHINHPSFSSSEFPTGGLGESGFGSSSFSDGLLNLSNRKSIVNKTWWSLSFKFNISFMHENPQNSWKHNREATQFEEVVPNMLVVFNCHSVFYFGHHSDRGCVKRALMLSICLSFR